MQNEGLVKIVVGKNFEEIVMDDTKDVFLYVNAHLSIFWPRYHALLECNHDLFYTL